MEGNERDALAVFDLDGTLCDTRHRLHLIESTPRDWNAFFRAAPQDPPLDEGVRLARQWAERCELGYVTGRPERCRADTERWLDQHGLPQGELWMRGERDRRPAKVAKLELLTRLAARRRVAVVVDDDAQVCAAYRRRGFEVVRADWMPSAPTLREAQHRRGRT
ncbi:hypothetical protein [Streptomyces sp. NPDC005438]|uniref:phosphatase domain-containing protein n=1 Tax=Streptomyces sp. NPDC005438 TaxID=3156880 RepID=UPI0033B23A07